MKTKTVFIKYVMKSNYLLINTEEPVRDYPKKVLVKEGEEVDMKVTHFPDGRIYYTIFKLVDGVYYCYTHMREASGRIQQNCGGIRASYELAQHFKK